MPINETIRVGWDTQRAAISSDDTLLNAAADTMKFANLPSYAFKPSAQMNAIELAFTMAADGESCAAYLFACRLNGDIVLVWDGTITAGKQEATDESFYVDTIASSTDNWITTVKEVAIGAADDMSRIVLDTCGYYAFFTQFTGLSSEEARSHISGF